MAVPSSSSSSLGSREQGARLLCCYLLLIPIAFILVFAPVFVYADRRTSQKALLNFSVVVLIIIFSVMWRLYLKGTVGLRTPSHEERFTRRRHNEAIERRRLHGASAAAATSRDGTGILLEHHHHPRSSPSTAAAVYFSALSSDRHHELHFSPPLTRHNHPRNAMIVHLTIPLDMDRHHPRISYAETHLNSFLSSSSSSFQSRIVHSWPDNPPPYHVAVGLPAPDAVHSTAEVRQSVVESPPPRYDTAIENDLNRQS